MVVDLFEHHRGSYQVVRLSDGHDRSYPYGRDIERAEALFV